MNRRRPLAALLLSAATVAALAVPAGAAPAKPKVRTTWTHQTLRCATGHKSATLVEKLRGGVVDSWADNPCPKQYLILVYCDSGGDSPKCGATDVAPRTKDHLGAAGAPTGGVQLSYGPACDDGPGTYCEY